MSGESRLLSSDFQRHPAPVNQLQLSHQANQKQFLFNNYKVQQENHIGHDTTALAVQLLTPDRAENLTRWKCITAIWPFLFMIYFLAVWEKQNANLCSSPVWVLKSAEPL